MGIALLCGLGCGALSAWGVGGGTLLLIVMELVLGMDRRTAQGVDLLFFLPTAASALICHARAGLVDRSALRSAAPTAVLAALAGAWGASVVDPSLLRRPFGLGLLLCGARMLRRPRDTDDGDAFGPDDPFNDRRPRDTDDGKGGTASRPAVRRRPRDGRDAGPS